MALEPKTVHSTHDELTGKPCIHFGDTDGHVIQVHRDTGLGLRVSAVMLDPVLGVFPCQVDVELTPGQVQELMTYLKSMA